MIATPCSLVQPEGTLFFYIALTDRSGDILKIEIVGTILLCAHTGTIYHSGSPCQGSATLEGFSFSSFHQEVLCLCPRQGETGVLSLSIGNDGCSVSAQLTEKL
jgi:hypothetical protein